MANLRFPYCIGTSTTAPNTATLERNLPFALGTVALGVDNAKWIYGQATEAIAQGACTINTTTFEITALAGNHQATVAIASGQGAWVYQTTGFHQ